MDPENTSSSDTASSNTTPGEIGSSGADTASGRQHPRPEPVRQARASITALTSLFDDPLTLKPRVRPEASADEMAMDAGGASRKMPLEVETVTASWGTDDADSSDRALLARRSEGSSTQVSETQPSEAQVSSLDATDLPATDPAANDPIAIEPMVGNAPEPQGDPAAPSTETEPPTASISPQQQVQIKRHDHHLSLIFPPEQTAANPDVMVDFVDSELWQQLQQRLSGGERFWEPGTSVHLNAQNHLLDSRQLQELGEALDRYDLKLTRIATSRRQTAVAAATAGFSIDQGSELPQLLTLSEDKTTEAKTLTAEPLYLQTTIRSGAEVRHPGSVIIMGDLNPGSSVVADGDILIWGRLRGVAHAGAAGNKGSIILALKLEPTQLRIADSLARVPQTAQGPTRPEVAYVTAKGDIRITEAAGFTRPYR